MTPIKVKDINHLKELSQNSNGEFFIAIGILRSSKSIHWNEETKTFHITNYIDSSEMELTEEELLCGHYGNIGLALDKGVFYYG